MGGTQVRAEGSEYTTTTNSHRQITQLRGAHALAVHADTVVRLCEPRVVVQPGLVASAATSATLVGTPM